MSMRRFGDLMASVGEFTDHDGRKAKQSLKVGVMMKDDTTGAMSVKLDAVPVSPHWSGWLSVRCVESAVSMQEPAIAPPGPGQETRPQSTTGGPDE